ncbi:hypothetical protein GCM10009628_38590 [Paeniglutamicibacter kerguelensis]
MLAGPEVNPWMTKTASPFSPRWWNGALAAVSWPETSWLLGTVFSLAWVWPNGALGTGRGMTFGNVLPTVRA